MYTVPHSIIYTYNNFNIVDFNENEYKGQQHINYEVNIRVIPPPRKNIIPPPWENPKHAAG